MNQQKAMAENCGKLRKMKDLDPPPPPCHPTIQVCTVCGMDLGILFGAEEIWYQL